MPIVRSTASTTASGYSWAFGRIRSGHSSEGGRSAGGLRRHDSWTTTTVIGRVPDDALPDGPIEDPKRPFLAVAPDDDLIEPVVDGVVDDLVIAVGRRPNGRLQQVLCVLVGHVVPDSSASESTNAASSPPGDERRAAP